MGQVRDILIHNFPYVLRKVPPLPCVVVFQLSDSGLKRGRF
jgi:hypothetical protein